ncbi:hypothetical protein HNQ99_002136 [Rhizorhapis suberifaciens]|uniref:Uncharacterized protein n=1 Tax=Rhizorhapis suberifaciens TaxID=13656 RepID=A0A840HV33_9SPHN|nr:hypothetical protein [Rhizorhapis suberifaciens]
MTAVAAGRFYRDILVGLAHWRGRSDGIGALNRLFVVAGESGGEGDEEEEGEEKR